MATKTATIPSGGVKYDLQKWSVKVSGITPILFDRYPGDNKTKLEPHQKLYLDEDKKTVCLPATNVQGFLSSENTMSAPKRLFAKEWKKIAQGCLSYVTIEPTMIPFMRDGKKIEFGGFKNGLDALSGMTVRYDTARLKDGVPNPKERPILYTPWELHFTVGLYSNPGEINETTLQYLFRQGGIALGFGTFRGVFGKFQITGWSEI